jgi:phage/plasmid-associated DNA primase/DNA-dependent RNA polymerase auxiliary subunit epsilon
MDKISYTKSKNSKGYSYHFSIPSWKSTPQNIKRYFQQEAHFKRFLDTKELDLNVYSVRPLRLPMQTNNEKTNIHKIVQGKMSDFIVEYVHKITDELIDYEEEVYTPSSNFDNEEVDEEDVENLLECITNADDYDNFYQIGTAIKNLTNNFDIWNEWSKKSPKYKASIMKTKWNSFTNTDVGIALLKSLAKKQNKELYLEYFPKPEGNVDFIDNDEEPQPQSEAQPEPKVNKLCLSLFEKDIAQYIIKTYLKDNYVCVCNKEMKFFYYDKNRWIEDVGNTTLFKYVTKNYLDDLDKYQKEIKDKLKKTKDEDVKTTLTSELNNALKLICKLKGKLSNYRGIIEWIANELYNPKFYDECDNNIYLLGFNNGVYDTKTKTFRDGKPSDYVTKSVGYDYPTDAKGYRKDIDQFLKKVFPDKDVRKFVVQQQAQALSGMKGNDCVYTHSGKGSNGKSIEQILLASVFGDYFLEIPSTMLTKVNKMEHNKPDPFFSEMKGVRYSIANEPQDGSKINDSLIKIMGSKEGIKYRTLFSNKVEKLNLQTQLHIYCNNKLDFNANDGGVCRRLKVIDYVSKFSEDSKLINEENNIYDMDTELSEKVKLWREDYMKMLLELFDPKYKYVEPDAVKNASSSYCDANNDVKRFITEHFEFTNKKEDYLLLKDIKMTYQQNKEYDQSKIKNFKDHIEKEMKANVTERAKVKKNGKWVDVRSIMYGWKYRDDDCETED